MQFLAALGDRRVMLGDLKGAQTMFERAGQIAAAIGDEHSGAVIQGKIADILVRRGELDEALRIRREQELPVFTRLGAVREIAVTQGKIAKILANKGDLNGALELHEARLETNRKLQNKDGIAATLWDICQIELVQN
jgi:predicted negative regulator of RcsB-dependent stress response